MTLGDEDMEEGEEDYKEDNGGNRVWRRGGTKMMKTNMMKGRIN